MELHGNERMQNTQPWVSPALLADDGSRAEVHDELGLFSRDDWRWASVLNYA